MLPAGHVPLALPARCHGLRLAELRIDINLFRIWQPSQDAQAALAWLEETLARQEAEALGISFQDVIEFANRAWLGLLEAVRILADVMAQALRPFVDAMADIARSLEKIEDPYEGEYNRAPRNRLHRPPMIEPPRSLTLAPRANRPGRRYHRRAMLANRKGA